MTEPRDARLEQLARETADNLGLTCSCEVDAILSALRTAAGEWQSIDTAPKDGREVLAGFQGQFAWVTFVAICGLYGVSAAGYAAPTHWRPLPESPAQASLGSKPRSEEETKP